MPSYYSSLSLYYIVILCDGLSWQDSVRSLFHEISWSHPVGCWRQRWSLRASNYYKKNTSENKKLEILLSNDSIRETVVWGYMSVLLIKLRGFHSVKYDPLLDLTKKWWDPKVKCCANTVRLEIIVTGTFASGQPLPLQIHKHTRLASRREWRDILLCDIYRYLDSLLTFSHIHCK